MLSSSSEELQAVPWLLAVSQLFVLVERGAFGQLLAEVLSVLTSIFPFCFKESSSFTESSCKACGSSEEANNCVEVIVTNESSSCTCPSSGTLLGSPKIKKGMLDVIIFHFKKYLPFSR